MRCLITGASGFIGRALLPHLQDGDHQISTWPRHESIFDLDNNHPIATPPTVWVKRLEDIDVVIHLAGLAHQRHPAADRERFFRVNRDGTLRLAAAARAAGIKRFIFLSSAKVFGEGGDEIYRDNSIPHPSDAYAASKWQAEQSLITQHAHSPMEIVILRPPLVYGADAGANFARLLQLARLPLPLPVADIENQRALIGIDNLIDLIALCLQHPNAANQTLLCADADMYSLPDIIGAIRRAIGSEPRLFHLPKPLLTIGQKLLGAATSARLFGDFRMDSSRTQQLLGWTAPHSMEQILRSHLYSTPRKLSA